MIAKPVRAALKTDIEAHLLKFGPTNWKMVQERYPQVSPATFWRLVKEAKPAGGEPGKALVVIPHEEAPVAVETATGSYTQDQWLALGADLTPERLRGEYQRLLDDVERLRSYSLDSKGNVLHPATLMQSMMLRERFVLGAERVFKMAYNLRTMQEFYKAIVNIILRRIGPMHRDIQEAIIADIEATNAKFIGRPEL